MRIMDFTVDVPLAAIDDDSQLIVNGRALESADLGDIFGLVESIDMINNNTIIQTEQQLPIQDSHTVKVKCSDPNGGQDQHSSTSPDTETYSETLGGSLEDLVSNFDEKISQCFKDMGENTDNIAPVQMRTQDEIMSESQIWWTLTGNFGNILPIDWSKSYARKLQLPALRLLPNNDAEKIDPNDLDVSDDEELAAALDLHSLIQLSSPEPPPQTAEEVIEEIDEIMMQSYTSEWTACSDLTTTTSSDSFSCSPRKSPLVNSTISYSPSLGDRARDVISVASSEDSLWSLPYKDLAAVQLEMESLIQTYNECLVQELAVRGEMEYEKELKNCFISLLLEVQNKRRQWNADRKRAVSSGKIIPAAFTSVEVSPQYATAIIPYDSEAGPPRNDTLERLVKILKAVNDNSPHVPNMLTDYILNVVCPSSRPLTAPLWSDDCIF